MRYYRAFFIKSLWDGKGGNAGNPPERLDEYTITPVNFTRIRGGKRAGIRLRDGGPSPLLTNQLFLYVMELPSTKAETYMSKIVYLPDNKFALQAKIDRDSSDRFWLTLHSNTMDANLKVPIGADTWSKAQQQARVMLCIMHACLSYTVDGVIDLPEDMEDYRREIPRFVAFLQAQTPMVQRN